MCSLNNNWTIRRLVDETINPATQFIILKIVGFLMRNHFTNKTFRSSIGHLAQYSIINLSLCFLDNVLMGNRFANNQGVINLANNFTCGRNSVMGNIVTYASPYLYPFVVEYSLIGAAVVFAMWRSIGSNPRYYSCPSSPRWSTCVLVYFSWLLDHVIYLKLRREKMLCKAEQIKRIVLDEQSLIL